jgi:hypothetical protein
MGRTSCAKLTAPLWAAGCVAKASVACAEVAGRTCSVGCEAETGVPVAWLPQADNSPTIKIKIAIFMYTNFIFSFLLNRTSRSKN